MKNRSIRKKGGTGKHPPCIKAEMALKEIEHGWQQNDPKGTKGE